MSRFMPFAIQEKERGYFNWSPLGNSIMEADPSRTPPAYQSRWGANGQVTCQQLSAGFTMAWLQDFQPGCNCPPIRMLLVDSHVALFYVLSGSVAVKSILGDCTLTCHDWQFIPGMLSDIELHVNSRTKLLLLLVPASQLFLYRLTFPDIATWLVAPTFYTWRVNLPGSDVGPLIHDAVSSMVAHGWKQSADTLWQAFDRILLLTMGELSISLCLAGSDSDSRNCLPALVSRIRMSLLLDVKHRMAPPLSHLARLAAYCGRSLQRAFKEQFGLSMMEYFLGAKMEAIARELLTTSRPLQVIALEYSYQDYSAFSKAVRNWWGMSPRLIRKVGNLPVHNDRSYRVSQEACLPM